MPRCVHSGVLNLRPGPPADIRLLLFQSLARLGANTLAIDASGSNITTAQTHAALDPSLRVLNSPLPSTAEGGTQRNTLEYRHTAAERLVEEGKTFDVVCAMEVVEHVEDPRGFLECLMQLTKVGLAEVHYFGSS